MPGETKKRSMQFNTVNDLRRFHQRIISMLYRGEIDIGKGNALSYMCMNHYKLIRDEELEAIKNELQRIKETLAGSKGTR